MGGTESIVDVQVSDGSELLGELRVVLLLFLVEADIFEEEDITIAEASDSLDNLVTDAVVGLGHLLAQELGETGDEGGEAELVLGAALGAAQVRGEHNLGTVVGEVLEGGDGSADAGVVGDVQVGVQGNL